MTWVKICGITNLEDALVAVEAGADAVGFVFHEKSPRKVDVETARAIVKELPERVEKVGVFVEQSAEEVREIVGQAGLGGVQIHGGFDRMNVDGASLYNLHRSSLRRTISAMSIHDLDEGFVISGRAGKAGLTVLLDSGKTASEGGTGNPFDWEKAQDMVESLGKVIPVVVAGGLNPCNVTAAMRILRPFGVDVSSGVEAHPGKKDPEKVRAFVRAVREADRRAS